MLCFVVLCCVVLCCVVLCCVVLCVCNTSIVDGCAPVGSSADRRDHRTDGPDGTITSRVTSCFCVSVVGFAKSFQMIKISLSVNDENK